MQELELLSILPEYGVLGAFIAVVVTLVVLFLNHIKQRDEILLDVHKACEEKISIMTNKCIDCITDNSKTVTELKAEVRRLDQSVNNLNNTIMTRMVNSRQ